MEYTKYHPSLYPSSHNTAVLQKAKESGHGQATRKYLITWTLVLERAELETMSAHPESLEHALNHVKSMIKGTIKGHDLQVYRIVSIDEVTSSKRHIPTSARPTGIAIVEAHSLEEVRAMLESSVDGLSYGGMSVPVSSYLEYDIKLLADLGLGGGE
jgi:hypothetical protein